MIRSAALGVLLTLAAVPRAHATDIVVGPNAPVRTITAALAAAAPATGS